MNELINFINDNSQNIGIETYIVKYNKEENRYNFEYFQTSESDQQIIQEKVVSQFTEILETRTTINLTSWDERGEVIYKYNLEDEAKDKFLQLLNTPINPRERSFNGNFKEVYGILHKIGTEDRYVVCYSQNIPLNTFSNKLFGIFETRRKTFELIKSDTTFKLKDTVDLFLWNNEVYISNLKVAEKNFGVDVIIMDKANETIEKIENIEILEDIEVLKERVQELSFSRKLMRIKEESPVLKLPISQIITFTKTNKMTKGFKYSENGKIILDTKNSQELFIKLLNDDFLHSQLTGMDYVSNSKDSNVGE